MLNLQKEKNKFYKNIFFKEIVDIYAVVCKLWGIQDINICANRFWGELGFKIDESKFKHIINLINNRIKY